MLHKLEAAALICVDTETDSLEANRANLVGIAFAVEDGAGWYVPVAHDYLGVPPQLSRDVVLGKLKPLLEDAMRPTVGQNLKYDIKVFARHGIIPAGVAPDNIDTKIIVEGQRGAV